MPCLLDQQKTNYCNFRYAWEVLNVALILAQMITGSRLGKEISFVAMSFGRACLSKISPDLHKYDTIITHTVGVYSNHIRDSANHVQSKYSMI